MESMDEREEENMKPLQPVSVWRPCVSESESLDVISDGDKKY